MAAALPRAAPVTSATLPATGPGPVLRRRAASALGCTVSGSCRRRRCPVPLVGARPARAPGRGAGPRGRPRGRCGGRRSRRPAACRDARGRASSSGRRWPQSTTAAAGTCGCAPVQGSSRCGLPVGQPAEQGPQLAPHPGPLQPGVGVGQVAGQRQQRAGDLVGGDQGHLAARRRPATRPRRRRRGRPPGRGPRPDRRAGRRRRRPGAAAASTTAPAVRRHRRRGRARPRWRAPRPRRPGGRVEVVRRSTGWPVSTVDPEPGALGLQPVGQHGQPLAAGADGRRRSAPPSRSVALDHPHPVAPEGQHPGALEAGHAGPDHQGVDRRVGAPCRRTRGRRPPSRGRERGSPTQLTSGLRLSRTRQAWLQRMQGRTRSAAAPARTLATRPGSAIWARVISTRSAVPSASGRLRPWRVDHAPLEHHGGTRRPPPGAWPRRVRG